MHALTILYRDDDLVAVDKPSGLLVHRSSIDAHESRFLLQALRDQIGVPVSPVHRLDKGTSGVVVFALHADAARRLGASFRDGLVRKTYVAIVRGWAPLHENVDHPLTDRPDRGGSRATTCARPAFTEVQCLARVELAAAVGRYATARYSLVACRPRSGRMHQIRRHLKHLHHPVIGDANYGDGAHNRFFRQSLGITRLLLAASAIRLPHPRTAEPVEIVAPLDSSFLAALARPGWRAVVTTDTDIA
jgi:tRNA pseudouridine65 synthase